MSWCKDRPVAVLRLSKAGKMDRHTSVKNKKTVFQKNIAMLFTEPTTPCLLNKQMQIISMCLDQYINN